MHVNTVGRFVSYWGIFDNTKHLFIHKTHLVSYFVLEYLSLTVNVACGCGCACGCAVAVPVPCEHGYDVITGGGLVLSRT